LGAAPVDYSEISLPPLGQRENGRVIAGKRKHLLQPVRETKKVSDEGGRCQLGKAPAARGNIFLCTQYD